MEIELGFEVLNNRNLILKAIREGNKKSPSILWQNIEGLKEVYQFSHLEIDQSRDLLRIKISDSFKLKLSHPIFVKLSHRNTIFKGEIIFVEKNYLFFKLPGEVQVEEYRAFERIEDIPEQKRELYINTESELVTNAFLKVPFYLKDVSQSGMGIIISEKNKHLIKESPNLFLSHLGDIPLTSNFQIDLVRSRRITGHKQGEFLHLGLKFRDILTKDTLMNFLEDERGLHLSQTNFLKFPPSFKRKLNKQMKATLGRIMIRKDYLNTILLYENDRAAEFIPHHVKSLSYVSCAIAKLLGLDDRLSFEQLIYICFIHDIAFYKNAKLAKLKNRSEFEQYKIHLTLAEQQLYFKAPAFSVEYTYKDRSAPPGVEVILDDIKKYRTEKDIEKFVAQHNLSYHLAIFVVAHAFLEEAYDKPHLSMAQFLEETDFYKFGGVYADIYSRLARLNKVA